MKKSTLRLFVAVGFAMASLASCSTINKTMREPNTRVNLTKSDFTLSDQVTAEATSVKVLGIDFSRLTKKKMGAVEQGGAAAVSLANIPVIGSIIVDKTASYSLFELMSKNPGYDVVFYPQYETKVKRPFIGIGFIVKKTTVKTTARLGRLNK